METTFATQEQGTRHMATTETRQGSGTDTILRGVSELHGRFTAHTGVTTKTFKTRAGAERYLAKFGLRVVP